MIQVIIKPEDDSSSLDEQDVDNNVIDIEDGETFVIPKGYVGEVIMEEGEELEVRSIIQGVDLTLQFPIVVEDGDELTAAEYELKGGVLTKRL